MTAKLDGPFKVLQKVNANAYKLELPSDYSVSNTFNVSDLIPFHEDDLLPSLRIIVFKEGEDDEVHIPSIHSIHAFLKDHLFYHGSFNHVAKLFHIVN